PNRGRRANHRPPSGKDAARTAEPVTTSTDRTTESHLEARTVTTTTADGQPAGLLTSPDFLQAALNEVQTNLFIADTSLTLIYANARALDTLRQIEGEVRKAFGVDVDEIVGASIHRFHKDKRGVEKILRNPKALPHTAEFAFGSVTLQANINSITAGRDVVGYVVCWENVSQRRVVEAEQSRLASMLENAPTNVLLA